MQTAIFDTPINNGLKVLDPNSITVADYLIYINLYIMQCYLFTSYRLSAIIIIYIIPAITNSDCYYITNRGK